MSQRIDAQSFAVIQTSTPGLVPVYGELKQYHLLPQYLEQHLDFYSAHLSWNLGWADFSSSTGGSKTNTQTADDASATLGPLIGGALVPDLTSIKAEKVTEELRLTSKGQGAFQWLGGAFFTREIGNLVESLQAKSSPSVDIPALEPLGTGAVSSTYKEYAIFGDATYRFNSILDITGGLRWSHNAQTFQTTDVGFLFNPAAPTAVAATSGESSEHVVNFMVSPQAHLTDDTMLYARIASGYRPGGPNPSLLGIPAEYGADRLINYELGVKSTFAERRASIDVAAFHINWTRLQVGLFTPAGESYLANAGTARSDGFELSSNWAPFEGLHAGLNGAFTHSRLTESAPTLGGESGDEVPYVPRWNASAIAQYEHRILDDWHGQAQLAYRYVGARYSDFESASDAIRFGSYQIWDLNAALVRRQLTMRVFLKNALDHRAYLNAAPGNANGSVVNSTVYQPRTIGIGLDLKY